MQLTQAELEAVSARQVAVMDGSLRLIAALPDDPNLIPEANIMSTADGLVGAIAMIAEASGLFPDPRRKRHFADTIRVALMKSMTEARAEVDARMAEFMGVANDTVH